MAISRPQEPVYYYECSAGSFRLVHFMPPEVLERLKAEGAISAQALEDFPDGVDLGCTTPDFDDFENVYGYRPPLSPDALRDAFFALFSSTHAWKKFRGSGFLPATELEEHVAPAERALEESNAARGAEDTGRGPMSLAARRRKMSRKSSRRARAMRTLEKLSARGIDSGRPMNQQRFAEIRMKKGLSAEEVFVSLHQRKIRPR